MHGRVYEERKKGRHMWSEPIRGNSVVGVVAPASASADVSSSNSSLSPTSNSFFKDGRRISVGDCALFKPPQDSPPFIGIIRWLTTSKENQLKLCVNWLYRPSEVKLGKGIRLEAAPNEVFYSFHKDEIPAASLLHPCKVAFLAKGVELPSGFSSFVCRRVYDITNKCLWWLTDQDYINERQEEVDQLLYKTQIEMNATVQPGGRSPKPINGPTSASHLKSGADNLSKSSSSFPSHVKGKKRERGDQSSEPVKKERAKVDDGDSAHSRTESFWRSEISKFTEKGGLVDFEGVEKLVQLMLPEKSEKKIDIVGRSVLASVVAATDKLDCLTRFVQLRGLPVFDEWLQEVHKGKVGDCSVPKDGDKSIEEFLLVLLRALDKLPVNLHALQMCNIGKSVNHLRTLKNVEIQKKAKSLVDTWKKRVEAEMDAKSQAVSWAARPRLTDISHSGNKHSVVSSEFAVKSSSGQISASKNASIKLGETATKSAAVTPGSVKSAPSSASISNNLKVELPRNTAVNGGSELPLTVAGDEKSSSSSQSHNNCQSCSSDHAKTGGYYGKEDARSPTAMSVNANKITSGSSRHRKSMNGFAGANSSGVQKETGSSRTSLHRNPGSEKLPQSTLTGDKVVDVPVSEGNSQKLIVKLSNRVRSPARSASGGSLDDPSVMNSRASSPVLSEKHDLKEKNDAYRANTVSDVNNESWQSNDFKEVLTGSDERDGSPTVLDEDNCRTGDDSRKSVDMFKAACSSSGNEHKSGKSHELSFSPINALIESANASISVGDDVGMNLLASVAAGVMSKSDTSSPCPSPQRNITNPENSCTSTDLRMKSSPADNLAVDQRQPVDGEHKGPAILSNSPVKDAEDKPILFSQEQPAVKLDGNLGSSSSVQQVAKACTESNVKSEEMSFGTSLPLPSSASVVEKTSDGVGMETDEKPHGKLSACVDAKEELCNPFQNEQKVGGLETVGVESVVQTATLPSLEIDGDKKKKMVDESNVPVQAMQKPGDRELMYPSDASKDMDAESVGAVGGEHSIRTEGDGRSPRELKTEKECNTGLAKDGCMENLESSQCKEQNVGSPVSFHKVSPEVVQDSEQQARSRGSKLAANDAEPVTSAAADTSTPSAAVESDMGAKVEFDLNEGLNGDDGKFGELNCTQAPECASSVQLISPLPLSVSSTSCALPASITVTSAAKRPFVPPEDLLKIRGELGWKGSAATSAFRPAEPRKSVEAPICNTSLSLPDQPTAKPSRPPLDIDLNVPDEQIIDDMACLHAPGAGFVPDLANNRDETPSSASVRNSGVFDLDLNRVDEPADVGNHLTSNSCRLDIHRHPVKMSSNGILNGEVSSRRDFDLNDGPLDEVNGEPSLSVQHARNSLPPHSQLSVSALRMNNAEMGNFPSWFSPGHPYPAVTIQPILPDRGEQPFPVVAPGGSQRMLTPASTPFSSDIYRGSVLSSSPAVPFTSTPFQYPVFPFGTSFPLPSATFPGGSTTYVDSSAGSRLCFPAVPSQVLAPSGAVQSHYSRPFIVSLPDNNNSSADTSRKWGKQGLDLNAGPLGSDIDGRDESSSVALRQLSVASSQSHAEEQSRMYQVAGGSVLKRKEPDGGWESYKQSSWQ